MNGLILGQINPNLVDAYNPNGTYQSGEYCIKNDILYKANQNIDTPEEFTAEHWTKTTVGKEINEVKNEITNINTELESLNSNSIPDVEVIPITPLIGTNYSSYGNSYYYKKGTRVHIHIGIGDFPSSSGGQTIANMPEGCRPRTSVYGRGIGNTFAVSTGISVSAAGTVAVYAESGEYIGADIEYDVFS